DRGARLLLVLGDEGGVQVAPELTGRVVGDVQHLERGRVGGDRAVERQDEEEDRRDAREHGDLLVAPLEVRDGMESQRGNVVTRRGGRVDKGSSGAGAASRAPEPRRGTRAAAWCRSRGDVSAEAIRVAGRVASFLQVPCRSPCPVVRGKQK